MRELSAVDRLAWLPAAEYEHFVASCDPETLRLLADRDWSMCARPGQIPSGDWFLWLLDGGRGSGKTESAAQEVVKQIRRLVLAGVTPRVAAVARTLDDVRRTMLEGETGLLHCMPAELVKGGDIDRSWNRSTVELFLANAGTVKGFSSEKPSALRGPQHHIVWVDEAASLKDAAAGPMEDTTWSNMVMGLRLEPDPRLIVSTTPKNNALYRAIYRDVECAAFGRFCELVTGRAFGPYDPVTNALVPPKVVHSLMTTYDNLHNLAPAFAAQTVARYAGTRLGEQELMGRLVGDIEGALWLQATIDSGRVYAHPPLDSVVVAVDPQGENKPGSAETGIVAVGIARHADGKAHLYVLEDATIGATPEQWAGQAVALYHARDARRLVGEVNNGGDMVRATVHSVDPTVYYDSVRATRGKAVRAEPVQSLYTQGRVHHVGFLPLLEAQMTSWTPPKPGETKGDSPDRIDALVWACTYLLPDIVSVPSSVSVPSPLMGSVPLTPGYVPFRPQFQ